MNTVVILSGGMDSAVLLYLARHEKNLGLALSFNYGQRHRKELLYAEGLAREVGVDHETIDVSNLGPRLRGSSQTDETIPVPEGHYAEESMKKTVVPNRNMIMLSIAAGIGISRGLPRIGYAAHGGDHAIYPDCRPEFVVKMNEVLAVANWTPAKIWAPFLDVGKHDLVTIGRDLGVPFDRTWSCYKGGEVHCGKCGTCVERREAFELSGVPDPTVYA